MYALFYALFSGINAATFPVLILFTWRGAMSRATLSPALNPVKKLLKITFEGGLHLAHRHATNALLRTGL